MATTSVLIRTSSTIRFKNSPKNENTARMTSDGSVRDIVIEFLEFKTMIQYGKVDKTLRWAMIDQQNYIQKRTKYIFWTLWADTHYENARVHELFWGESCAWYMD